MVVRSYRRARFRRSRYPRRRFGLRRYRKFKSSWNRKKLSNATVYRFKRMVQLPWAVNNIAGADAFGAETFSLSDLPNYTEFTNLYDQYKITGVKLTMIPSITQMSALPNYTTGVVYDPGSFIWCVDYNDQIAPANVIELYQRQSTKIKYSASRPFSIFLRPRALASVIGGAGPSVRAQWVDTTDPNVDFFGLKWCFRSGQIQNHIDVYASYYLKFKNTK